MLRRVAPLVLVLALAACNTGDSFLEWDEETQARLDAEEAAANGEPMEAAEAGALPASAGEDQVQVPFAILTQSGEGLEGFLRIVPPSGKNRQATVTFASGDTCTGGLVSMGALELNEFADQGTFALSCSSGAVWLGDYVIVAPGEGSAAMRDQTGAPARMVFGTDVTQGGVDPAGFEALWQAREVRPQA